MTPDDLMYTKTHEWVRVTEEDGAKVATIGLTAFALELLTDVVLLDLPETGKAASAGGPLAEVESVKAVSDIYSPVDGEVISVNSEIADALEQLAEDPYGQGWLMKIRIDDEAGLADLMDKAAYEKQCEEEA